MTKLVGILNLTPDSFSDGYPTVELAMARYEALVTEGADMVDVGAESTRPGASPLSADAEWARLQPFLSARKDWPVPISLDTYHATTAQKALDVGVTIINDVGGLGDPAMRQMLSQYSCPIIVMHSLTVPADPNVQLPETADPVAVIQAWRASIAEQCAADGISENRLIYDPGIGFGKTAGQSMQLIERARELVKSPHHWMYGHSRKSFLKPLTQLPPEERDAATLVCSEMLIRAGVQYLRVHDVASHRVLVGRLCH